MDSDGNSQVSAARCKLVPRGVIVGHQCRGRGGGSNIGPTDCLIYKDSQQDTEDLQTDLDALQTW